MEKKQLTLVVVSLLVVVLSVSVSYFTAQIIGSGKSVSVTSANLEVVFNDTDGRISATDIEPGWTSTKTFTVKNSIKSEYKYNIIIKNLINTFVTDGYLQYKITSETGGYNMSEFKDIPKSKAATDIVLVHSVSVLSGVTQSYTIEFRYLNDENVDQSIDMGKTLSGSLFITEGTKPTLYTKLLEDKAQVSSDRPIDGSDSTGFTGVYTADNTKTMYSSLENNTKVYYFAGNALDNWVEFGGYYWRIIRTNADGGIRLLYHGTSTTTENAYIGTSAFNGTSNDAMYAGYMYGTSGSLESNRTNENDSTIKSVVDLWYESNLKINYGKYLSDTAVYCNDREVGSGVYSATGSSFNYVGLTRLRTNKTPTYDCKNIKDAFSVSNNEAKLTYPVGLMTADEVSFAGGDVFASASTYYYNNSTNNSSTGSARWWTMTPNAWYNSNSDAFLVLGSSNSGNLNDDYVYTTTGVRPVVSLKSCVKWYSGNGTSIEPYTIVESESGC